MTRFLLVAVFAALAVVSSSLVVRQKRQAPGLKPAPLCDEGEGGDGCTYATVQEQKQQNGEEVGERSGQANNFNQQNYNQNNLGGNPNNNNNQYGGNNNGAGNNNGGGRSGGQQGGNQGGNQGGSFQCQNDGAFPDPSDCSKFFQCHQGTAAHMSCPAGLEFNPQNSWCDFPNNNQGGGCQRISPSSQANAPCLARNGNGQAYYVGHPQYCNAFFGCGNGLLYPGCTFCPQGMYFDEQVGQCVSSYDTDVQAICQGRQMIPPAEQEIARLEASCRPGREDVFAPLLAKIRGGGGFGTGQGQGQGGFGQQQGGGFGQGQGQGQGGFGQQQGGGFGQGQGQGGLGQQQGGGFSSSQSFQTSSTQQSFGNQQGGGNPQTFSRGRGYFQQG